MFQKMFRFHFLLFKILMMNQNQNKNGPRSLTKTLGVFVTSGEVTEMTIIFVFVFVHHKDWLQESMVNWNFGVPDKWEVELDDHGPGFGDTGRF